MNIDLINTEFKKKNISITKLANECGLGYATCHDILSGKKTNPTIETIHKIASFLNLSIDKLMEEKQ